MKFKLAGIAKGVVSVLGARNEVRIDEGLQGSGAEMAEAMMPCSRGRSSHKGAASRRRRGHLQGVEGPAKMGSPGAEVLLRNTDV
jgi:hypothetical protein